MAWGLNANKAAFRQFAQPLDFASITAIPTGALKGDNLVQRSAHTPWYAGPTLMAYLETVRIEARTADKLVFPLQPVKRDDASFVDASGSVAEGKVKAGDEIRVAASGQTAKVAEILTADGSLKEALAGDAVMPAGWRTSAASPKWRS